LENFEFGVKGDFKNIFSWHNLSSKVDSDVCSALCLSALEIFKKASKVEFWKILSLGQRGISKKI
jgi:hypothetical protein